LQIFSGIGWIFSGIGCSKPRPHTNKKSRALYLMCVRKYIQILTNTCYTWVLRTPTLASQQWSRPRHTSEALYHGQRQAVKWSGKEITNRGKRKKDKMWRARGMGKIEVKRVKERVRSTVYMWAEKKYSSEGERPE
jgi:hypothetical protein